MHCFVAQEQRATSQTRLTTRHQNSLPLDFSASPVALNLSLALQAITAVSRTNHQTFVPSLPFMKVMEEAMTACEERRATANHAGLSDGPVTDTPAPVLSSEEDERTGSETAIEPAGIAGAFEARPRTIWLRVETGGSRVFPNTPLAESPRESPLEPICWQEPQSVRPEQNLENTISSRFDLPLHQAPELRINISQATRRPMPSVSSGADDPQYARGPMNRLLRPAPRQTLSSQGPNSPAFLQIRTPHKTLMRDDMLAGSPKYAAYEMGDFLPFTRTKIPAPLAPHIIANCWQTTEEIQIARPPLILAGSERCLVALGQISSDAGSTKHLVYDANNMAHEHTLVVLRPGGMDGALLRRHINHLRIVRKLAAHRGIAAFREANGDLVVRRSGDGNHVWYLEVSTFCDFNVTIV